MKQKNILYYIIKQPTQWHSSFFPRTTCPNTLSLQGRINFSNFPSLLKALGHINMAADCWKGLCIFLAFEQIKYSGHTLNEPDTFLHCCDAVNATLVPPRSSSTQVDVPDPKFSALLWASNVSCSTTFSFTWTKWLWRTARIGARTFVAIQGH